MLVHRGNIEHLANERFKAEKVRKSNSFGKMWFKLDNSTGDIKGSVEELREALKEMFIGTCIMMYTDYLHKRFMFEEDENEI